MDSVAQAWLYQDDMEGFLSFKAKVDTAQLSLKKKR